MTINQLSIFIENKSGTLIRILDLLSKQHIQIIASMIADTQEFGIYRVICSDSAKAYNVLHDAGLNVQLTDILAVKIDDKPGAAAEVVKSFTDEQISIAYMYSFLLNGYGVLAIKAIPADKAKEVIMLNKFNFITENDLK